MSKLIFASVFCAVCLVMMFLCLVNVHRMIEPRIGGTPRYAHAMMSAIGGIMMGILVGVLITAIFFVFPW